MKGKLRLLWVICLVPMLWAGCKKDKESPVKPTPEPPESYHADDLPSTDNTSPSLTIQWSTASRKISHEVYSAEYGRIKKLGGDSLLLLYHCGPEGNTWDNIALRKSFDGGQTWAPAEIIVPDNDPAYYGFANPELLIMKNGWPMLAYTGRGNPDDNAHDNIQIRISKDRGQTWGNAVIAARGRSWEPAMIQFDNNVIELFYSSEAAWWPGANPQQEILMVSSADNGTSWNNPVRVAYTSGMRDGMATPLLLKDNKGIVFPIESVNNSRSPFIVWSSVEAKWNYKNYGTFENGRRWLATTQSIWGGAPYIIQLTSGETILSVQDAGGRVIGSDWKKNTMLVLAGNSVAKNFTSISYPWPNLPTNEGAYYSSTFLKNDNTIVLVTTRNFANGHSEIFWKEGTITR